MRKWNAGKQFGFFLCSSVWSEAKMKVFFCCKISHILDEVECGTSWYILPKFANSQNPFRFVSKTSTFIRNSKAKNSTSQFRSRLDRMQTENKFNELPSHSIIPFDWQKHRTVKITDSFSTIDTSTRIFQPFA